MQKHGAQCVKDLYGEATGISSIMKLQFHPLAQGRCVTSLLVDARLEAIDNVFCIIVSKEDLTVLIDIAPMFVCVGVCVGVFVCLS